MVSHLLKLQLADAGIARADSYCRLSRCPTLVVAFFQLHSRHPIHCEWFPYAPLIGPSLLQRGKQFMTSSSWILIRPNCKIGFINGNHLKSSRAKYGCGSWLNRPVWADSTSSSHYSKIIYETRIWVQRAFCFFDSLVAQPQSVTLNSYQFSHTKQ